MNFRTTVILFVIVVVGGLYIALFEMKRQKAVDQGKAAKKVVGIENLADKATKVRIQAGKGDAIVVERKGEDADAKWAMVEPRKLRTDKSEVRSILSGLEFLDKKAVEPVKESGLAKYGLDTPQGSITFWVDGEQKTLLLGSKCPDDSSVWARMVGVDEVYMVSDSALDKAKKSVNDLRDRNLVDVKKDDVTRVALRPAKGDEVECAMEATGWVLKKPVQDQGNKDEIEKLIDKLKGLQVDKDDFVEEEPKDLAKYGLKEPQLVAAVYIKDVAQTVLVGSAVEGKTDKLYAKREDEPAVVAIKKSFLEDMTKESKDLRDKKVARFETKDVTAVEINIAGQTVALAKEDSDWKMSKPKETKADSTEMDNLFRDLGALEVVEFPNDEPKAEDLAKYGLQKPTEIALTLKDDKAVPKLLIGAKKEDTDQYYMKRDGQAPVLLVGAKDVMKRLAPGYLAFRNRLVLEFNKSDAKKLTVKRDGKTFVAQVDADDDSKWQLLDPIKTEADKTQVDNILWDLYYLRAQSFITENPDKDALKTYGLDKPSIVATVEYEEEVKDEDKGEDKEDEAKEGEKDEDKDKEKEKEKVKVTKVLLVGKKADDDNNYFAKLQDDGVVFTIGESRVNNLREELASKTIMEVEKDKVTAITLVYADKTAKIEKKDDKWEMDKKEYDKDKVDKVLDTLASFRAKTIAAYAAKNPADFGLDKPYLTVRLKVGDGQKTVIVGGKKEGKEGDADADAEYYVKADGKDFVYVVKKDDVDKLAQERPAEPEPEKPADAEPDKKQPAETKPAPAAAGKPAPPEKKQPAETKPAPAAAGKPAPPEKKQPAAKPK